MNKNIIAMILTATAVGAIIVSGILLKEKPPVPQVTSVNGTVQAPPEETKAPDWVNKKPENQPDYSAVQQSKEEPAPAVEKPKAVAEEKPAAEAEPVVVEEDDMVTFGFVESAATTIISGFKPGSSTEDGRPASTLTFKQMNMKYGRTLDGFAVNSDEPASARKTVLNYIFVPQIISVLSKSYGPLLTEHLTETAMDSASEIQAANGQKETRKLTATETSDMLRVNAAKLIGYGKLFSLLGNDSSITAEAGKYLQAVRAVERANARYQDALTNGSYSAEKRGEAGEHLKDVIHERERIRDNIIRNISKACENCDSADMFYATQWAYRRVLGDTSKLETLTAIGNALSALGTEFNTKADALLAAPVEQ